MNLEALNLTVEKSDWSPLEKSIAKRKFRKIVKRNEFNRLTPLFLYRYCAARLHLGDYSDYTGWEWRSDDGWAAKLLFEKQPLPRWDGGYVEKLCVLGEQGVGDEVFYASLIPECLMRVKEVVYECDERLHKIIERSFPRTKCIVRPPETAGSEVWESRSGDFIPAGDLLRIFRRHRSHFPGKSYLKPDPDRVGDFSRYAGRTGVAWRGRQGSLDPLRLGITDPLSVQYGVQEEGIEFPPIDLMNDLESLFALCSVLNKVVTVPQSVQHFAGSIGTKVEIVIPEVKGIQNQIPWDYSSRILPGGKLPWYPDVKVFDSLNEWKVSQFKEKMFKLEQVEGFTRI